VEAHLLALGTGILHLFSTSQQDAGVPEGAAGVYTIWRRTDVSPAKSRPAPGQLLYVGYSGRGSKAQESDTKRTKGKRREGLWSRLAAHASGRRSGNQFAVYVADRFVLPTMSADDIEAVAAGTIRMDALVRSYTLAHLAFRWVETADAVAARKLEARIRRGRWDHGKPFLNPQ
jgi:hypothetical protein